jgi:hypothetical protein
LQIKNNAKIGCVKQFLKIYPNAKCQRKMKTAWEVEALRIFEII